MQATNLVQETPQTTNKQTSKKQMIEEETSTKTPQTWTLDSHQNQSSNFVKSLYKYGVSNGRQSTHSFNPKHKLLFDLQTLIYFILSDEEAIKELDLNEKSFFWVFFLSFFLSCFLSSHHPFLINVLVAVDQSLWLENGSSILSP
jgi:hypothetical protein